ncbi:MAG: hypothetical protein P0S95_06110 [Rhabdochlamydiaceae bacterium]|nr:hypothetical protein [Candidatus Amphrikana amoebophyrae]
MLDKIILILLISIVSLSVLREIPRFETIGNKFPFLMQLIPIWSFFAPVPNIFDYNLFYREINEHGSVQNWKKAYLLDETRPFYTFLWNPKKRFLKGVLDAAIDLMQYCNNIGDKDVIATSTPYLQLLNFVNALVVKSEAYQIQYMIMSNSRLYKPELVFLSSTHLVSRKG